jgi:hypothetical protein
MRVIVVLNEIGIKRTSSTRRVLQVKNSEELIICTIIGHRKGRGYLYEVKRKDATMRE